MHGAWAGPNASGFLNRVRRFDSSRGHQSADELALIAYDDEVNLIAPLAPVDQHLVGVVGSIFPGGQNLSGGWLKGVEELRRASGEGPRKVLLLTDGLANVGHRHALARGHGDERAVGRRRHVDDRLRP